MPKYENFSKEELLRIIEKQEQELAQKKYGLVWDAEREPEQVVLDCENNLPVLKRVKGKEIRTCDEQDNILIEGDNYHALTVLNYTHKEKIDVIYIDPPYNTGNKDFIYNDRYVEKEDGYRHSKWLNFMEKRLNLAQALLKETGVIFISIDDNEVAQLKLLCDKVFGENNFVANIIIQSNPRGKQQMNIATTHEYLLIYSKNIQKLNFNEEDLSDDRVKEYSKVDKNGLNYREMGLRKRGAASLRVDVPNLYYPIYVNPKNRNVSLKKDNVFTEEALPILGSGEDGRWRWGKKKFEEDKDKLYGRLVNKNRWDIFEKDYLIRDDKQKGIKAKSVWDEKEINYENAKKELREIFNGEALFEYPKTLYLIKKIIKISSDNNSVALDFMAGSGTTGHAVLELNKEDGGNRKFILCTNNELNG
ncbi:site-specific DNA-methyltransferase [Candidatus Parcubacteria bacterium]|nr:site-specific DNA-methyltransferase [Candidatus Parcubacteria bacterium]